MYCNVASATLASFSQGWLHRRSECAARCSCLFFLLRRDRAIFDVRWRPCLFPFSTLASSSPLPHSALVTYLLPLALLFSYTTSSIPSLHRQSHLGSCACHCSSIWPTTHTSAIATSPPQPAPGPLASSVDKKPLGLVARRSLYSRCCFRPVCWIKLLLFLLSTYQSIPQTRRARHLPQRATSAKLFNLRSLGLYCPGL